MPKLNLLWWLRAPNWLSATEFLELLELCLDNELLDRHHLNKADLGFSSLSLFEGGSGFPPLMSLRIVLTLIFCPMIRERCESLTAYAICFHPFNIRTEGAKHCTAIARMGCDWINSVKASKSKHNSSPWRVLLKSQCQKLGGLGFKDSFTWS